MIALEYLVYSFLLLIVGMLIVLNSIRNIFEIGKVDLFLSFLPFAIAMLGLIPFLISTSGVNKLFFDAFIFLGFLFLAIAIKLEFGRKKK